MKSTIVSMLLAVVVVTLALVIGATQPWTLPRNMSTAQESKYEGGSLELGGETDTESVPVRRPRGPYIVIDRYCNKLFLRTADSIILEALCSTGSGGELTDAKSGRRWKFDTPAGVFVVSSRLVNPWWRKPDWAFIEEGQPVPQKETERLDDEMMGDFALGFGDGYFIHGSIYERLLGAAVTHGCIRVGAKDLKKLYENTRIGTTVYVF